MNTMFTESEIAIFKAWLLNKKNKEIAEELKVSEAYVSQTLNKIENKIGTLKNSVSLLEEMRIIESAVPLKLTDESKQSFLKRKSEMFNKISEKSHNATLTFSPESFKNTITKLLDSIINPSKFQTRSQIAISLGLPVDVVDAVSGILDKRETESSRFLPYFRKWIENKQEISMHVPFDLLIIDPDRTLGYPEKLEYGNIQKWMMGAYASFEHELPGDVLSSNRYPAIGFTMQLKPQSKQKHEHILTAGSIQGDYFGT